MKAQLEWKGAFEIEGSNAQGVKTIFDNHNDHQKGGTPMEIMLQSMAACSVMDILSILQKKRKTIEGLHVDIQSERAEEHPKVFTKVHLVFTLISPDAELKDLERSVELSQTTYCSASAMFQRSGCEVTSECIVKTA